MRYITELRLTVSGNADDDEFDRHTDEVLDALYDCEGVIDPDITVAIAERKVLFVVTTEASDSGAAGNAAFGAIRTAIHESGGATPGWESALAWAIASTHPADAPTLLSV